MLDFDTMMVALIELKGMAVTDEQWEAAEFMIGWLDGNEDDVREFIENVKEEQ
jgi:hypothetical protein